MGESLRRAAVDANDISTQRLLQGVRDGLSGKATFGPDNQRIIRTLIVTARARAGDKNHAAAHAFLVRNGKKKGVVTTASGLQYEVLNAGQGTAPKTGDSVIVNYRGTLLNGTEFDSSYKRGQPANFEVGRVIPGWNEALQLMKPGAKFGSSFRRSSPMISAPAGSADPAGRHAHFRRRSDQRSGRRGQPPMPPMQMPPRPSARPPAQPHP